MYLGIFINDSHISAAMLNQIEEVVPIRDAAISNEHKSATSLKIYIEDNFAYTGILVDNLIANNYNLHCAKHFLNALEHHERTVYTDQTGVAWNASGLLSIFLKKLKGDIVVYDDNPIRGAMVTTTRPVSINLTEGLKMAFEMADLPFCGVVDMGKAALHGYNIIEGTSRKKKVLLINLDPMALTISVMGVDKENYTETLLLKSEENLGENMLHTHIIDFLARTYHQMTGKKIKKSPKNAIHLKKLAKDILFKYFSQS
ncbi:MAG: hypothetical protein WBM98_16810, partial [Maribacter sp.]|uniref:hypothetical protein n=1 Tax=Maribacter sp. TaxID=1897614 RepID=UPI003C70EBA8